MRRAKPRDVEGLAQLEREVFGDDAWSRAAVESLLDERTLALVEDDAGRHLAYAAFRTVLDEAELLRVAVRSATRRRGLARRLLVRGFEILAAGGVLTCHLEVRDDNVAALRLYEDLGFERVGRRPSYYADGCDAAHLSKRLSDKLSD